MEFAEPIIEHIVTDYEFMFYSGTKFNITVDPEGGDTFVDFGDRYVISIQPKPYLSEDDISVVSQEAEVLKAHLAVVGRCVRKQRMPTKEETVSIKGIIQDTVKLVS